MYLTNSNQKKNVQSFLHMAYDDTTPTIESRPRSIIL